MSRIDDAVSRILRVKMRAGLWEKPAPSLRALAGEQQLLGAKAHRLLAHEAVCKSMVLLKNKNEILPLLAWQPLIVLGSAASSLQKQCGGWSTTWQGTETPAEDFPGSCTVLQAVSERTSVNTYPEAATHGDTALVVIGLINNP